MCAFPWFTKAAPKPARAPRIRASIPLHFRVAGGFGWKSGTTENISQSGVLFRTDQVINVGTAVEMQYSLPAEATWTSDSHVSCRGRIVRVLPATSPMGKPAFAAQIVTYGTERKAGEW